MQYSQAGNTSLPDYGYSYDQASNIEDKTFNNRSGSPKEDYAYDALHRLTRTNFGQRSGDPFKGWTYDDLGNHLTQNEDGTTPPGSFNAVNEQTSRGGSSMSWSKTGNLTEDDQGREYSYDRQNMLTEATDGGGAVVFEAEYDALGRRIEVTNPGAGTTHRFYFDAMPGREDPEDSFSARIIERTDGSGTVQQSYVWGN